MLGKEEVKGPLSFRCAVFPAVISNDCYTSLYGVDSPEDNKWHQIVGTYDGKEMRFYYDGELYVKKRTWGQLSTERFPVYIGEDPVSRGSFFKGLIDDVRIYSYALSPEEVKMLYEGKEPPREKRSD